MKNYLKVIRLAFFFGALTLCFSFTAAEDKTENPVEAKEVKGNDYIYMTNLSGSNENPAVSTAAKGKAIVRISKDESSVYYKIIVQNIDSPSAAHFHMGMPGMNGPVIVGLYMGGEDGIVNGLLTEGVLTSDDTNISMLINSIRSGSIYVNVHTPANPRGELRGQL
ncbi:CHRD domain-containing protein [Flavobacteriaceae bacterium MAR_2010_188]|nr:CHRD domain-containing protein [Flavobacteriaceae bacterium MAR_2010_188]